MLTEVLSCLGWRLSGAEHLLDPAPSNRRGFFEDGRVLETNERLLQSLGASWYRPWPALSVAPTLDSITHIRETWGRLEREDVSLVKDPRISILLPWWLPALSDARKVDFFRLHRDPTEVAASLTRLFGFPQMFGELLWFSYEVAMDRCVPRNHVVEVFHADLIANPREAILGLLGVEYESRARDAAVANALRVISPALYTQRNESRPQCSFVAETWDRIRAGGRPFSSPSTRDELLAEAEATCQLII